MCCMSSKITRNCLPCILMQLNAMELQDWTPGTSYELLMYKLIMWPLGIWPLNKGEILSKVRLLLAASTQATTFICLSLEIMNNCRGVEIVLDLFVLSVFSLLACIKGLIVHHHINDMNDNLTSAILDWSLLSRTENPGNRELMMNYARLGRLVCFSLMIPASSGTLSWIILALPLPMFTPPNSSNIIKNFPLQTACTFDPITTSRFYYLIFVLQMYQLVTTCLGNCGNDVFFFGLSMHTCGQLEILQNDFADIDIGQEEPGTSKKLKDMVNRHVHLIELVDKLESTFSMIILAQLIMSAVLICIMGLQVIIALKTDDMFAAIKANIVLSSLMSQLFLYSYGGDCLTTQTTSVVHAIYKCSWYDTSSLMRKNIAFIMMRANKPIYVTAGNFFYMTLSTFMDILKASVSYMSVLRIAIDVQFVFLIRLLTNICWKYLLEMSEDDLTANRLQTWLSILILSSNGACLRRTSPVIIFQSTKRNTWKSCIKNDNRPELRPYRFFAEGLFLGDRCRGTISTKCTMRDSSRQSTRNLFFLYSHVLTIYGVWPLSDDTIFLKTRIAFAVGQMIYLAIIAIIKMIVRCGSSEDMVDTFLMLVVSILVGSKCILLYVHRNQLGSVVVSSAKDWDMTKSESYRKMMSERANFCQIVTKLFYSLGMFVLLVYVVKVMVLDVINVTESPVNGTDISQKNYLLPGGCIFDGYGNSVYYFVVINQALQLSVTCSINLGGDAFYVAMTLHLCEQCEILKLKFKKFGRYDSLEKNRRHLNCLIARHQDLMGRAETLEDVYNEIILMQMLMSVLLISVGGFSFLVSLNDGDIIGATKNICIMQFMLTQSYIYTFPADDLKEQADGLLCALYSSQWCDMPTNIMKDMVFMMMRISVPPYYTAGKFFYMTRQSYMTVVKTAASYLSVLRIMIE
ncbi:uncharacterized protein LOC135170647 [Diachasmimorpha longicaudata]|uniref:uncharacterized protein LOC135170647 n=1 Tax=Diachasmimorpha longicaudata TaxID=58733 RepID=UPI0030B87548